MPRKPADETADRPAGTKSSASKSVNGAMRNATAVDELGQHSAETERDYRAEDGVTHHAGHQFGARPIG